MKSLFPLIVVIALCANTTVHAQNPWPRAYDDTSRFIFYSVLEGLYEDGVSNEDVDQILMKKEGQSYFHFIYSCPICSSTVWALQAYRSRPRGFYGMKDVSGTFGRGLSDTLVTQLYSDDPKVRLTAINAVVKSWIERRMKQMNLSEKDRAALVEALEKKRKEGMVTLESFRKHAHGPTMGVAEAAPAYVDLNECAVCNGACGKPMKLPEAKPK